MYLPSLTDTTIHQIKHYLAKCHTLLFLLYTIGIYFNYKLDSDVK